jgi:chromosome segregation ATPase
MDDNLAEFDRHQSPKIKKRLNEINKD